VSNAYDKLVTHMSEMKIGYWSNSEEKSICVDFPGLIGNYRVFATVDATCDQFQVIGQLRMHVAKGCHAAVTETVQLANNGLTSGELEMNFDTSELRFRAARPLVFDILEDETIDCLLETTKTAFDTYLPALISVIYGNETPEDAVRHVAVR
jgi:hypothetical protein